MIVTKIHGGLGNQMFQFAVARALSLSRQESLGLDITEFGASSLHNGFELERVFGLETPQLSSQQLRQSFGWRAQPWVQRLAVRWPYFPLVDKRLVLEPHLDYWAGIEDVPSHVYLSGYWQSERYFQAWSDAIRFDFQFKEPLESTALLWSRQIQAVQSVALHIRRGDYVTNPVALAYHGTCSLNYYHQAITRIAQQVICPEFFVFSDDLVWARENLCLDYPVYFVDDNQGTSSYRDMQLMSQCSHHIIANSSFSWWGAWLARNESGVVIAPDSWYAGNQSTLDLIPSRWIRIAA